MSVELKPNACNGKLLVENVAILELDHPITVSQRVSRVSNSSMNFFFKTSKFNVRDRENRIIGNLTMIRTNIYTINHMMIQCRLYIQQKSIWKIDTCS